jgi:hypothetical protein
MYSWVLAQSHNEKAGRQGRDTLPTGNQHPSSHSCNREPFDPATQNGRNMWESVVMEPVTVVGTLLAAGGMILAQAPQPAAVPAIDTTAVGVSGIVIALSGVLTLILNTLRSELQERRAHELNRMRLQTQIDHNQEVSDRQQRWIVEASKSVPDLPPPPKMPNEETGEHGATAHP